MIIMKSIGIKMTKGLTIGSKILCIDNSGAKEFQIIGIKVKKGVRRRLLSAGIGDKIIVRVTKGLEKLKGDVHMAVIVRQKKEFQRADGMRVKFEDNAAIMITEENTPKGSKIKGPIAKEAVERFISIGKISRVVY